MSDIATLPLAFLNGASGFRSDTRFAEVMEPEANLPAPEPEVVEEDPLAQAWEAGFAAGLDEAAAMAKAEAEADAAAREGLGLQFARLDAELAEGLRQRLYDTVLALCESALAPLALDAEALLRRIERAVAMLQRAGDERIIRSGALDRSGVREQFDTGVRTLNALTTFGVGQRIGIMAGSGVGKSVLLDMIARGADADVVIVGLIGERAREVSDFVERHMSKEKRERTAIIAVPADHAPNLRLRGAMLATSLAEYFRHHGQKVLLILDSLTRVAHAAREIGLLLREPGAARGYPPSALATITKLVERAGNSAASGGSITGVYTVLADGDNHDDPVVDTARSILDGHVVLSRELAQRGQYPAIDIAASLSRVMNDIVTPQQARSAREFRALSASYEENRDLVLMGAYRAGADPQLDRAIAMHQRLVGFIQQDAGAVVPLGQSFAELSALLGHEG